MADDLLTPEKLDEMDRKAGCLINANDGRCELAEDVATAVTYLTYTIRKMRQAKATPAEPAATWAIVELMGHRRLPGRLSEEERFGEKLGRIDVPDGDGFVTTFFGGKSVYAVTVVTEAVARDAAKYNRPLSPRPLDYPQLTPHDDPAFDDDGDGVLDPQPPF